MVLVHRAMVRHLAHARHVVALHDSHAHCLAFILGKTDPLTDQRAGKDHQHGEQTEPGCDNLTSTH